MYQPPYLKQNDTVAIVATARKISLEEIKPAIKLLENWGLNVFIGKTIGLEANQFAGTDEERTKDFQEMLNNPNIKAIWCARGGYGTVRIIDELNFSAFKKNPKWIIGYSDITALHSHIHNLGFETLHATMPINVSKNTETSLASLKNSLFGNTLKYKIPPSKSNRIGTSKGNLVGGNLSILYSLLGSKTSIKTANKILFIEDLDEYLYHIDRMLVNLKRNGYFDSLKGLIVGGFTKMSDNEIPFGKTAEEMILEHTKDYNFPIVFNFPAGHLDDNYSLILGRNVELNVTSTDAILKFQ